MEKEHIGKLLKYIFNSLMLILDVQNINEFDGEL